MEAPEWEACSFELARTLVDAVSRDLADAQPSPEGGECCEIIDGHLVDQESYQGRRRRQDFGGGAAGNALSPRERPRQKIS